MKVNNLHLFCKSLFTCSVLVSNYIVFIHLVCTTQCPLCSILYSFVLLIFTKLIFLSTCAETHSILYNHNAMTETRIMKEIKVFLNEPSTNLISNLKSHSPFWVSYLSIQLYNYTAKNNYSIFAQTHIRLHDILINSLLAH